MSEYIEINSPYGKIHVDKSWIKNTILESKSELINLLDSSNMSWNKLFKQLNQDGINAIIKIGSIGELDLGYNKHKNTYTATIKGLEDVTDGAIGVSFRIIGFGDNLSEAIISLVDKIDNSPDFIVRDIESGIGFRDIIYDQEKKQYHPYKYVLYGDYKSKLENIGEFEKMGGNKYKDLIIYKKADESDYRAYSNVIFDDRGEKVEIIGKSPLEAGNSFISFLQDNNNRYYKNGSEKIKYRWDKSKNMFL